MCDNTAKIILPDGITEEEYEELIQDFRENYSCDLDELYVDVENSVVEVSYMTRWTGQYDLIREFCQIYKLDMYISSYKFGDNYVDSCEIFCKEWKETLN